MWKGERRAQVPVGDTSTRLPSLSSKSFDLRSSLRQTALTYRMSWQSSGRRKASPSSAQKPPLYKMFAPNDFGPHGGHHDGMIDIVVKRVPIGNVSSEMDVAVLKKLRIS